jgi:hypothetical protein
VARADLRAFSATLIAVRKAYFQPIYWAVTVMLQFLHNHEAIFKTLFHQLN